MRRTSLRTCGLVLAVSSVLLTGCGGSDDDAPPAAPPPDAGAGEDTEPVQLDPACEQSDVEQALCRFVVAVQAGDLVDLSEEEQAVAAVVTDLPGGPWTVDSCELEGDVTVLCQATFTEAPEPGRTAGFYVGPVNGEFNDGRIIVPEGETLRYEVNQYLGLGKPGSFGPS
jgi:hypothetical protein